MNNNLTITRAQAGALARLIHQQLTAYAEASGEPGEGVEGSTWQGGLEPFTGADLDIIEPLVARLEKLARE